MKHLISEARDGEGLVAHDLFATFETVFKGVVVMKNNASCRVARIGTVKLKLLDGTIRTLGQGCAEFIRVNQHKFSTMVDILLGTIPLRAHKWSDLKNTVQWSSGDIDNAALLPSPAVSLYSIARDGHNRKGYVDADFVEHALSGVEGV
ncbi:unnamed protein product [Fraxinus pennsylvanica]|uniref:Uncharacterized protein n=1 Tax=Fraxinus pennsylvanica TaxID=56036 RepID=A0AAD1ZTX7_9LAMI|nr:unnamed protein product [Fraxinus pennsylvanica]